jgi:hypothetical protein
MDSLKNYAERLATELDLTPAALYERQRQLVRLGLISTPSKTGPGAGVRATPDNVAMLLLSCMASDSLSEIATRIMKIARLRSQTGKCPLTQATNFGGALKAILSNPATAARVSSVHLLRTFAADIHYRDDEIEIEPGLLVSDPPGTRFSQFGASGVIFDAAMVVTANVYGKFLQQVANDLHQKE